MFSFVLAMTAAFLGAPAIAVGPRVGRRPRDARRARSAGRISSSGAGSGWRRSSSHMPRCRGCSRWLPCASCPATCRRSRCSRSVFLAAPGGRAADVRDAAQHAAAGDRERGGLRRAVRARLDGRRVRRRSAGSSMPGRSSRRPRRRAGCCRPTACGAARSTRSSRRSSSPGSSASAARGPRRTRSSRRPRHRPSSSSGRVAWVAAGARGWRRSRCRGATCSGVPFRKAGRCHLACSVDRCPIRLDRSDNRCAEGHVRKHGALTASGRALSRESKRWPTTSGTGAS